MERPSSSTCSQRAFQTRRASPSTPPSLRQTCFVKQHLTHFGSARVQAQLIAVKPSTTRWPPGFTQDKPVGGTPRATRGMCANTRPTTSKVRSAPPSWHPPPERTAPHLGLGPVAGSWTPHFTQVEGVHVPSLLAAHTPLRPSPSQGRHTARRATTPSSTPKTRWA